MEAEGAHKDRDQGWIEVSACEPVTEDQMKKLPHGCLDLAHHGCRMPRPCSPRSPYKPQGVAEPRKGGARAQNMKRSWDVGIKRMSLCVERQTFYTRRNNSMWMAELYVKFESMSI